LRGDDHHHRDCEHHRFGVFAHSSIFCLR
jgi:hypothetical protein